MFGLAGTTDVTKLSGELGRTMYPTLLEVHVLFDAMAKSSQLMPLINTGNYRGGTNDKPGPTS